ncbi:MULTISPECIES: hypothetical protein [unclassified Variovorax]|uniref:hypothetical protein n=1 Tax=unclassified Variovorax TaxID=663243 RepID=UPI00076C2813|nr:MULTISPECIES: hypothetical protein [unclassified Variovorax]KWT91739.1 hypothetical protein APY03_3176 [Variovorax sp. WDL1]PNG53318.1 hypothetical protein CHC06_04665 [Variovorax sp. B2]PNG53890.1 hypothetical protein CHC07_03712 [Variovorax sp. B4]VTV11355.1 hypothetical protein WDL1CHR_02226 [Variovorax sp. WDL1]
MNRTTAITLATGALIGLAVAQLFPTAQAQSPETLIITSDDGVIVFIVDGQEKARIDAAGLHVNGDIAYSGAITDTVVYEPRSATEPPR